MKSSFRDYVCVLYNLIGQLVSELEQVEINLLKNFIVWEFVESILA